MSEFESRDNFKTCIATSGQSGKGFQLSSKSNQGLSAPALEQNKCINHSYIRPGWQVSVYRTNDPV